MKQLTPDHLNSNRSELRDVVAMATPMIVTLCSPMIMRVTDFYFVSKLGQDAQAAIVPAQMLMWCYIALCFGICSVINTLAAQSLGRGQHRDCSAYAWNGFYIALSLGLAGLVLRPMVPGIFTWIGHEPAVRELEIAYTRLSTFAILPTVVAHSLGSFFTGVHRPRVTMLAAVETNALNIVLNYGLIFGAWGLPCMGFEGAAMGTVLAASYHALRLLITLVAPWTHRNFHSRQTYKVNTDKIKRIFRIGTPAGIQWLSDVTVWTVFVSLLIGRFGSIELAAGNVVWQYIRMAFMPMVGIGEALTAMVGRALGQKDPAKARRITRIGIALAAGYIGVIVVIYAAIPSTLIGLFNQDAEVLAIGSRLMLCVALFMIFDVMGTTYYHALRGAGDTTWPMIVFVVGHWAVVVGGGYAVSLLKPEWGSFGPWIMATVLISLLGVTLALRWRSDAWVNIRLFSDEAEDMAHSTA
jgi:MATE family multidrug resistance protein